MNDTGKKIEDFYSSQLYPIIKEIVLLEKFKNEECEIKLLNAYRNSELGFEKINKLFYISHTQRVKVLVECFTHSVVKDFWINDNLNQYILIIINLVFTDFLPLLVEKIETYPNQYYYTFKTIYKNLNALPYVLDEEEMQNRKLIRAQNLIGGPIHNRLFEHHINTL